MVVSIGLVGAGRRAREAYAPALASCPEVRFSGLWGRTHDTARALADQYGVPAHHSFDELMNDCEAVVFAVPPAVQPDLAVGAARRDKSMLLERPISGDVAGAEQMVDEIIRTQVVTQLALAWRYAIVVREFLSNKVPKTWPKGGTARVVSPMVRDHGSPGPWQLERAVLQYRGPDLLDLLEAALGRIVGIRARADPPGRFGLTLEHQIGHYSEASLCGTTTGSTEVATVEIFGPGGATAIDCAGVDGPETHETMIREFAEAVGNGRSPDLDVNHGMHLQILLESAETDLVAGR
ncbi:MAG TPA: Gfo/Idh/MocA family oxidoreductase [Actinomadura sp.]|jgi:predicted dehydrogenase|nr:Gfo/Idh/MocA family oxidoreductase [Actinomadura sp.]